MKRTALLLAALLLPGSLLGADDPSRVLPTDKKPDDARLGKPKDLNGYFPMTVPASREAWEARRQELREQVLVGNGLWPLPEKAPLQPTIHGKIDRDDYTVEKVFFASHPGHYVCGNLYRPKGKSGKLPGVLCPHGHWANGRFYDAGEAAAKKQMEQGAEKTIEGARYPLQARCAQLARMGCVVFHYDMVGYADSKAIEHRKGFTDAEAELRLQNFMGLQTFNSIRALDFLLGLPDVDPRRVGVTGASGGGTQTFILGAVDDRPTVAFPAVMVSTAMQGGCVCENCSYLRVGTGNIELAGLFAPRPLAMSGAKDWTIDIETKGLPELKALYKLYGVEDKVLARCFPQFGHNYNQVSREVMYNWFNKYLDLGQPEPVAEKPFVPVSPKELSVFDTEHPMPKDALDAQRLRETLTQASEKQRQALRPKDAESLREFRRVVGTALRVMVTDRLPKSGEVEAQDVGQASAGEGVQVRRLLLGRKGQAEQVPALELRGPAFDGVVVVWVHPDGKASLFQNGRLSPQARRILEGKAAILAPDVFLTGEFGTTPPAPVNPQFAGFTFGYNRSLLANRVHDILTAVGHARTRPQVKSVHLLGAERAGPWVVLARGLCGDAVSRTAADLDQFRFEKVMSTSHEMMLPGALKYGGLGSFAALAAPGSLYLHNAEGTGVGSLAKDAFQAAGAPGQLALAGEKSAPEQVIDWLLR